MSYFGGSKRGRGSVLAAAIFVGMLATAPVAHATHGPVLSRTPSSIDFMDQQVGTPSRWNNVTVRNEGDQVLLIGQVTLVGTDPTQFALRNDSCSNRSVPPFGICIFEVEFAPTTTGTKNAAASIPSNDPAGPHAVDLRGNGVNPQLTRHPSQIDFFDVQIGTVSMRQSVFVQNTGTGNGPLTIGQITLVGTDPGQYVLQNDTCSNRTFSRWGDCAFEVEFAPTSTGTKNASAKIPSNDPTGPHLTDLRGTGVNPQLTRSPSQFDFFDVQIGTVSMRQSVFVQNTGTGNGPIVIGQITLVGFDPGQFALRNDNCSNRVLNPFGSCIFEVEFAPTAPTGTKVASARIPSNDPTGPHFVDLRGTAVNPELTRSPSSLDFFEQPVGTVSMRQTVSVQNTGSGNGPLIIGQITLTGAAPSQYAIRNDNCSNRTVNPFSGCTFQVEFAPTSAGFKTADARIPSNDPFGPHLVSLTGAGVVPLMMTPSSHAFGSVQLGATSGTRTATITNNSSSPASLDVAAVIGANPGDFEIVGDECSGNVLFQFDSCQIDVTFSPQATGARAGTLQITSGSTTLSTSLTGTGIDTTGPATAWTTTNNSVRVSLLQSVNGTASDPSGVASATVTFTDLLGSSTVVPATLAPCSGGNKSCTFSATVPLLLPGIYVAQIAATDALGNPSTGPTIMILVI